MSVTYNRREFALMLSPEFAGALEVSDGLREQVARWQIHREFGAGCRIESTEVKRTRDWMTDEPAQALLVQVLVPKLDGGTS